jgi:hypothetical protein
MDDIVKAALRKWPNVPACRGWLALDARGDWYMRDDRTQAAGPFPQAKGSRVVHDKLREFIGRNYEPDADGCWYFQNGPQRVYVELECTPLVLGVRRDQAGGFELTDHTGRHIDRPGAAWVDECGRLYLETPRGLGLVRSADMDAAADAVLAGLWQPAETDSASLPARHGYRLSPLAMSRDSGADR